jgi:hypothetical protein
MLEWVVSVAYVSKEVDLFLFGEECRSNTVHWSVSPALDEVCG